MTPGQDKLKYGTIGKMSLIINVHLLLFWIFENFTIGGLSSISETI